MFFNSINGINRTVIKNLLKVTIEKTQNFDCLSLKICVQVNFWGAPTHADTIEL